MMKKTALYNKYRYSLILLRELVIVDFKLRYEGSFLGYLWALLRPLFLFMILYVVLVLILHIGKGVEHWGAALLLGIVMWNFFSEVVRQGLKSIASSGKLIRKINFPKYIIVLATSLSALINLTINLAVVAVFCVVNHVDLTWGVLLVPVFILELYIFAMGLAFLLGTINVKFRDIDYIWDVVSQALFYGSAIMFPINRVAEANEQIAQFLLLNPLAQSIQDARYFGVTKAVDATQTFAPNILLVLVPYVIAVGVFIIGAWYFHKRSPYFAEDV